MISSAEYEYTTQEDLTSLTPTKTDSYTYYSNNDYNWQDELATFNGDALTYDEGGNLTSYNGYTYAWENGRQLAQISNGNNTYSYTYDDNGIRTSKTVNGITTNYITDNGTILAEYTDSYSINYWYDEIGNPLGFIYKDKTLADSTKTTYIYTKNTQGDITGIIDSLGLEVATYTYDAWGNITGISGSLANTIGNLNSLRYRGYYYDTETGFYYLQSRYYNPDWCRFINADDANYIGQSGNHLGINAYAYCENRVVNCIDANGNYFFIIKPVFSSIKVTIIADDSKGLQKVAKNMKDTIKKNYVSDCSIVTIKADNANSFKKAWDKLKKNDIVVILAHGTSDSINGFKDFNKLKYKEIKGLICLSCNAAHGAKKYSNPCYKLYRRITGVVMGTDGLAKYRLNSKNPEYISEDNIDWIMCEVEEYSEGHTKVIRDDNDGWVYYHDYRRCKSIYNKTGKKSMTITQMIDYLVNNRIINVITTQPLKN